MTRADVCDPGLQAALQSLLQDRFSGVKILSVSLEEEAFCDQGVLEINVTFEGTSEDLVKGQPPGLYEIVRQEMKNHSLRAAPTPVFNFISRDASA